MLPMGPYPEIREFLAMLEHFEARHDWNGVRFHAYTCPAATEKPMRFYVRRREGVVLGFSLAEWQCLKDLFAKALAMPELQQLLAELGLAYGEL